MNLCEKCIVRGKVQGVFYRASTQQRANKLGISGYAKNLPNGTVEVLICGTPEPVGHMKAWLWEGPAGAHVTDVKCELVEVEVPEFFSAE